LNAWQNIRGYKEMGFSFSSWLYRISRNAVIDFYRTRHPAADIDEFSNVLADYRDMSRELNISLDMEKVLGGMGKLIDEHREIIVMKFIEEFDNAEIAHILDK